MKNIVAISGSLRKNSYNTQVLNEIKKIAGNDYNFEILDISKIPIFNQDDENNNRPEIIDRLLNKIDKADLIIISTPEYNYSIPGVLKNALDWFSRGNIPAFINKKVAITSSSISSFGGIRAQSHLREVLFAMEVDFINSKELFVSNSNEIFRDNKLTDEKTLKRIRKFTQNILEQI
ncbi:MAG: NAD(P)H-dependent oxidoreductase [Bacilli bacterium]|nr:NAD(P)H-dependent oxidoreductase [Bacilli bacterium]